MEQTFKERIHILAKTNRMTSDTAVNTAEREIARTMDDEKQQEETSMEHPKEQQIEQMIGDAKQKQEQQASPDREQAPLPS